MMMFKDLSRKYLKLFREAAKKVLYLMTGPLRGAGGLNGWKKELFYVRKKLLILM